MSRSSRREFLRLAAVAGGAAALAACGATPTATPVPTKAPAPPAAAPTVPPTPVPVIPTAAAATAVPAATGTFKESPILADLVKAGKLPPVAQRLPKNPLVVNGDIIAQKDTVKDWKPGKYGGELRVLHNEPNNAPDVFFIAFQQLIRPPSIISGQPAVNNIVESWEISPDFRAYTFTFREGLKWSDGVPVTTEDIRFTYEDVLTHKDINATPPSWSTQGGKIYKLEIVNARTWKCIFDEPNGRFLRMLAIENWPEYSWILKPKHYLQQFHIKYTTLDKMKPELDKQSFGDAWAKLFLLKDSFNRNITSRNAIGMPVLMPWQIVSVTDETHVYERNPYYFKVDANGQQLPYLDKIVSPKVQDGEMENVKCLVGECDLLRRNAALAKLPLYKENEAKGGFNALILNYHLLAPVTLNFNMTYNDPSYRQVVGDLRFRKAISFGVDHKEIIDSVFLGQGTVPTIIPAGLNPTEANRLLDEMGMKVGASGFRTAVDGKPFTVLIEVGATAADQVPTAELVSAHLRKNLKLDVSFKKIDTTLYNQRNAANELQATIFWAMDAMADDEHAMRWTLYAGRLWNTWYTSAGKSGEAPPAWVKKGMDLNDERAKYIYGSKEYYAHKEIEYKYFFDNVPAISLVEGPKIPLLVSKKLGNAPVGGYQIAGLMLSEGMYFM